jgi:hypothetical protein
MADPSRREFKAGRKRLRPSTAVGIASAFATALHPLGYYSTAISSVASASQYDSNPSRSTPARPPSDPRNSSPDASLSSLSLAALASPWIDDATSHKEGESDRDENHGAHLLGARHMLDVDDDVDDNERAVHEGPRDEGLTVLSKGNKVKRSGPPPAAASADLPPLLQLGDFEKEVRMRFSDCQSELRDTMRSVRERLDAARRQLAQSDLGTGQRVETESNRGAYGEGIQSQHDASKQNNEPSRRDDDSTKPIDVVSAVTISPRRLSRMERQLSKKRERLLRALSSFDESTQGSASFSTNVHSFDDEPWGDLVSPHPHVQRRVSAQAAAAVSSREVPQAPRDDQKAPAHRKRVRVSASGHLHRVHRDLKGGGEGSSSTSSSSYYIPQIAQGASRRLFDAALRVADNRKTLKAHARVLVTALVYVMVASIAIRMLMWALFIRR